jgi:hypothetical protein
MVHTKLDTSQGLTQLPRHQDARLKVPGTTPSSNPSTPVESALSHSPAEPQSSQKSAQRSYLGQRHEWDDSDTEDSVIGTTTRRRAFLETSASHTGFSSVELRLYRKTSITLTESHEPVHPYGSMFLTPECTTSRDCFNRICEKIQTDCDFMVFQLPEDMEGQPEGLRMNRGANDAEATFQRVLGIFRGAKRFPGETQYRSVEVEVGLDMS